jgi:Bacterial protein of unknown function (Gcw_chp)
MKKAILVTLVLLTASTSLLGQFKYGADLYSRYLWRGLDIGNSPSFQPSITYTTGGLSLGFWGAYALAADPTTQKTYAEDDFWASYTFALEKAGSFSLLYTDYYFPYLGIPFGFYKPTAPGSAAHTLEGGVSYTGPDKFPISLTLYNNVSNDPDNSSYIQAAYPFTINETTLTLTAGLVPSKSAYYGTTKGGLINLGINVAKSIVITDKFSLPINVSYINNPSVDASYLVFGVSLTL